MDFPYEALFAVGGLLALMALSVPIGVALFLVSFLGIASILGIPVAMRFVAGLPREVVASWEFSAVPMFLLMGSLALYGGLTDSLFRAARLWLGWVPGGLAVATNIAATTMGAATGSSMATTVAIGRVAIPEMNKSRYDIGMAAASCACAGTIAALIPPSIPFIVYAMLAEQSIVKLFAAGIVPGLMTALGYIVLIIVRSSLNPELAPREAPADWASRIAVLKQVWPLPTLVALVFGGLYGGYVGPTEAGALGCAAAFLLALAKRNMSLAIFRKSLREAAYTTGMILFVAIGAVMLARYFALVGLPDAITQLIVSREISPVTLLIFSGIIFVILGMFLDPMGLMLLSLPIFLPLYDAMGFNLIWFGVIVVKFIEIGLLTPPLGMNVFAIRSVLPNDVSLGQVYGAISWFLLAELIIMILLMAFPVLSLWLPNMIG